MKSCEQQAVGSREQDRTPTYINTGNMRTGKLFKDSFKDKMGAWSIIVWEWLQRICWQRAYLTRLRKVPVRDYFLFSNAFDLRFTQHVEDNSNSERSCQLCSCMRLEFGVQCVSCREAEFYTRPQTYENINNLKVGWDDFILLAQAHATASLRYVGYRYITNIWTGMEQTIAHCNRTAVLHCVCIINPLYRLVLRRTGIPAFDFTKIYFASAILNLTATKSCLHLKLNLTYVSPERSVARQFRGLGHWACWKAAWHRGFACIPSECSCCRLSFQSLHSSIYVCV